MRSDNMQQYCMLQQEYLSDRQIDRQEWHPTWLC